MKHSTGTKFKCAEPSCDRIFKTSIGLQNHTTAIHQKDENRQIGAFKCLEPDCNRCFKSIAGLIQHNRHKHLASSRCTCPTSCCIQAHTVAKHQETSEEREIPILFDCDICGRKYSWKKTLNRHRANHGILHDCHICRKKYQSLGALKNHNNRKYGDIEHECDICGKKLPTIRMLHRHRTGTHSSFLHECHVCNKKFRHRSSLYRHKRAMHEVPLSNQDYDCNACGKRIAVGAGLLFECKICGETSTELRRLQDHQDDTHHRGRCVKCNFCNSSFDPTPVLVEPSKDDAQAHGQIHEKQESDRLSHIEMERAQTVQVYIAKARDSNRHLGLCQYPSCDRDFTGIESLKLHHLSQH